MRNLKLISAFVLFILTFSLVAAGTYDSPMSNEETVYDIRYDFLPDELVTRTSEANTGFNSPDLSTKFGSGILSWISSSDHVDNIPIINNEYSIMMFVNGDPTLGGQITPLGWLPIGDTGIKWVHTTVPNLKSLYRMAALPSVLMMDSDLKSDGYVERSEASLLSLIAERDLYFNDLQTEKITLYDDHQGGTMTRNTTGSEYVNQTFGIDGTGVVVHVDDWGTDFGQTALRGTMALDANGESTALDAMGQNIALSSLFTQSIYLEQGNTVSAEQFAPLHSDADGYIHLTGMDNLRIYDGFFERVVKPNSFGLSWLPSFDLPEKYYVGSIPGNQTGYAFGIGVTSNDGLPQVVPFLIADGDNDNDYESLYIDYDTVELATLMYFPGSGVSPSDFLADSEFNFTKYPAHTNVANQYLSADTRFNDGFYDISVGALGNTIDRNNVTGRLDTDQSPIISGIDVSGEMFAFMSSNLNAHGTWTVGNVVAQPTNYVAPGEDRAFTTVGVAPGAKVVATSGSSAITAIYNHLWASGFEAINSTKWEYTGNIIANISSNSYGFPIVEAGGQFVGFDFFTIMFEMMTVGGILHPDHPGLLMLFSAGNAGNGYSTTGAPWNHLGLLVGASTSLDLTGPWFINFGAIPGDDERNTAFNDEISDFSSSGPSPTGYPKIDILANGYVDFSTSPVHALENDANNSVGLWSGTSASSPNAAGVMALMYQAWAEEFGTPLDGDLAKAIIKGTAVDLGYDSYRQGAGRADAKRAVHFILNGSQAGGEGLLIAHTPDSVSKLGDTLETVLFDHFGLGQNDNAYQNAESNLNPFKSGWVDAAVFGGIIAPGASSSVNLTVNGTVASYGAFYYGTDHIENSAAQTMSSEIEFDKLYDLFDNTALNNAHSAEVSISISDESFTTQGGVIVVTFRHDDNNSDGLVTTNEMQVFNIYGKGYQSLTMNLGPRLMDENTYFMVLNLDDSFPQIDYSYSIKTYVETAESDITITDIGGDQYTVEMSPAANAEAGFREGFIRFSSATDQTLVPFSYSVSKVVGNFATSGFAVVDQLLGRPFDNALISANNLGSPQVPWDFRFLDFTLDAASAANTLAFEITSSNDDTELVAWVLDADGYFAVEPTYEVNSAPNTIRLLVNITDYRLGDTLSGGDLTDDYSTFKLVVRSSSFANAGLPQDQFTVKAAWVTDLVSDFATPEGSLITTGTDTYNGLPVTTKDIGVSWTSVSGNPIPDFNSTSSDLLLSVGAATEVNIDDTIPAGDLVPYGTGPMTPELIIPLNLVAGMEATASLSWTNEASDFDLILVPKGAVYDFPSDVFGGQASSLANPESAVTIIPATGEYELVVEWFDGPISDQEFSLRFLASLPLETVELEDTLSYTLDLTSLGIADAVYALTSSISGWNFPNKFSGSFLFDTAGPSISTRAGIGESATGAATIATISDATPYSYSVTKDGTEVASATDQSGLKEIQVNADLIEGVLVENVFEITAEDALGKTSSATVRISRSDNSPPQIEGPEEVTGNAGSPIIVTVVVDDAQAGTYVASIFGDPVADGAYIPGVETDISVVVEEPGEYLMSIIFTDGGDLFTRFRLKLLVDEALPTSETEPTETGRNSFDYLPLMIFTSAFVTIVRTRKFRKN
ncbi:MAG: S8 family serine peptidase [Candidatus Kariarchaeaceae archaeon]|jgi:hypothetical protein